MIASFASSSCFRSHFVISLISAQVHMQDTNEPHEQDGIADIRHLQYAAISGRY